MKDYIFQNIDKVSTVAGLVIFGLMVYSSKSVADTNLEEIYKWYFILMLIVGVVTTSQYVGKWLINSKNKKENKNV
jgi:tellurite resistance protein TehA-like permease